MLFTLSALVNKAYKRNKRKHGKTLKHHTLS